MEFLLQRFALDGAFVAAQVFAAVAFILGFAAYQCKARRSILLTWAVAASANGLHFFFLGRADAAGQAFLVAFRQLVAYKSTHKGVMVIFLLVALLHLWITASGLESGFILYTTIIATIANFQSSEKHMRELLFFATASLMIFNIVVMSPVAILMEMAMLASNLTGYMRLSRTEKGA